MKNEIYNESCHNTLDRMPPGFIDAVVTSPPYGNMRDFAYGLGDGGWDFDRLVSQLWEKMAEHGVICWIVRDQRRDWQINRVSWRQVERFVEAGFFHFDTLILENKQPFPSVGDRLVNCFQFCYCLSKGRPYIANVWNRSDGKRGERRGGRGAAKETRGADATIVKLENQGKRKPSGRRYQRKVFRFSDSDIYGENGIVWQHPGGAHTNRGRFRSPHPSPLSWMMAARLIHTFSKPGGLIYDPFNGCGTVTLEAKIAGRKWCGSEIVKEYHNVAMGRMGLRFEPPAGQKGFDFGEKNE